MVWSGEERCSFCRHAAVSVYEPLVFRAQLVKSGSMDDMVLAGPKHQVEVTNANAPIMTAVTKIVTSVEGKDKVFRTLFFGFKLLRAATQRQMMPVQLLETALLDARRVFRLFREVEPLQALLRQVSSGKAKHPWIKACQLTQLAGLVGFLIANHLVLLTKVKLLKLSPGRLRGLYGICFLVVQSAGLIQDVYRMYLLRHAMSVLPAAGEGLTGERHSAASARSSSPLLRAVFSADKHSRCRAHRRRRQACAGARGARDNVYK